VDGIECQKCKYCEKLLPLSAFKPSAIHFLKVTTYCRECRNTLARNERQACIDKYGGKCTCCGETRYEFLAFDHINGSGNKHRRELKGAKRIQQWLKENNYPEGFRILCHNCNLAKGFYGRCPHEE